MIDPPTITHNRRREPSTTARVGALGAVGAGGMALSLFLSGLQAEVRDTRLEVKMLTAKVAELGVAVTLLTVRPK